MDLLDQLHLNSVHPHNGKEWVVVSRHDEGDEIFIELKELNLEPEDDPMVEE